MMSERKRETDENKRGDTKSNRENKCLKKGDESQAIEVGRTQ
jgi:hypothetical protein